MELDEKIIFEDLFSKLSININNYKSENFLDDLLAFLNIPNSQNNKEIYKYTIFFFITNREKISYLLNSTEKELGRRELLKFQMEKFIKHDHLYLTTNEMFFSFFPEVFQDWILKKNRNNLTEKINQNLNIKTNSSNGINQFNIQNINQPGVNQTEICKNIHGIKSENLTINQNKQSNISVNSNNSNSPCEIMKKINLYKEKPKTSQDLNSADRIPINKQPGDTNNTQTNLVNINSDNSSNKPSIEVSSSNKSQNESFNPFSNLINPIDLIKQAELNNINKKNISNTIFNNDPESNSTNKIDNFNKMKIDSNFIGSVITTIIDDLNKSPDKNESNQIPKERISFPQISSKEIHTLPSSQIEIYKNTQLNQQNNLPSNQNQIISHSQSNDVISQSQPSINKKSLEKSISKWNQIMLKFKNFDSPLGFLEDYTQKVFKDNTNYLFPFPEKIEYFSEEQKLILLTIYTKFYNFFYEKQKTQIKEKFKEILLENFTDKISFDLVIDNLFYDPNFNRIRDLNKPIPKDFLMYILNYDKNQKDIENYVIDLIKSCKEKEDVMDLFFIFTINDTYRFLDAELQYKLLFFLYLILCKSQIFSVNSENQKFLEAMYLMKIYHKNLGVDFKNTFLHKKGNGDITDNSLYYLNQKLSDIGKDLQDFDKLFSEYDHKFCNAVLSAIKKFYKFENEIDLMTIISNFNNFEFTMNILELISKKEYLIHQNPKSYRNNLKQIESTLYNNYTNFNKNMKFNRTLYSKQESAYKEVLEIIDNTVKNLNTKDNFHVSLFPFGSVTQFLGTGDSDLDLYMHIKGNKRDKLNFLYSLTPKICEFYRFKKNSVNTVVSSRLITLTYTNRDKIKIDLNYFGICSVLNSTLLRVYALIDTRFVILAYNLKVITKQLEINNSDNSKIYLNSFSLMMLLVTFLQDIVYPPVLPKILKNSKKIPENIESGNKVKKEGKGKKNNPYKSKKTFEEVIGNSSLKEYDVNYDFYYKYETMYKRFLEEQSEKNQMTLAELFLKFLEFLIFYFKYDSIFVNCGFSPGEGFFNKSDLKNLELDQKFSQNFKYLLQKGDILIREPFDHGYNPAQTMEKKYTEQFLNRLKILYFDFIECGKLK